MAVKAKKIALTVTPREIARGEWGKQFYVSTFRFPLKDAQGFERRATALGLTMSSLVNQLVMAFNKSVSEPKDKVKLLRTKHPTIWGTEARKQFFREKGQSVPVKRAAETTKKKVVAKVAKKAVKVTPKAKPSKPANVAKKSSPALALLQKLKAMKKKNAA